MTTERENDRVHLAGIRAIVLDLDDTLYAERSFAFSGFDAVADWLRARINCPFDPAARMRELFETENRRHVFDLLLAELGCDDPDAFLLAMIECYRTHVPRIELLPDACQALDRWQGRFFLSLISDGPLEVQARKVSVLKLAERLDLVVLTDQWGTAFWKPHPRAFELVEQTSGYHQAACVYIADNPAKDFVAPNRLGWRTIQIARPAGVYEGVAPVANGRPEWIVNSLDQVDLNS